MFPSQGERDPNSDVAIEPAYAPRPPASCFIGDMAYDTLYALYLTPILLFQQKRQVLEPIKMSHGHLKAVPSRYTTS